jgi:hypothetical protein
MKNTIIQIALFIVIVVLVFLIYQSIMQPVRFNRAKDQRTAQVVSHLKDIRAAEIAYKSIHDKYTASYDTLLDFIRHGQIPVVKMVPDPNDTTFTKTIIDTTGYVTVYDSLFAKQSGFKIDSLPYIPHSGGDKFNLEAGAIEKSQIMVQVFEASALNDQFLNGLDKQLINNLNDLLVSTDRFPGLKVGSMLEPTTDGNWE